GRHVEPEVLGRMTDAMAHRGPDGEGTFVDGNVGLGHRRLSLIDLAGGHQPMLNEDGSVVVVFNGEIYNFEALSRDLVRQGHRFKTRSDTETLVHLFEQHGTGMFSMLRGMFAFALFDRRRRELYLVRDRYGIKPVYYHEQGGSLRFASEVKSLMAAGYSVDVNPHAVHAYLQTRFAHGDETIFRGVYRLAEGHYLRWCDGHSQQAAYYSNPAHDSTQAPAEVEQVFEHALTDAVASHMIADVPVGAYLSAGVDSSVLVSEMVRRTRQPVRTFCVDFAGSNGSSEAPAAEETARHLGCDHTTVTCGVEQLLELPAVVRTLEEPVGDAIVVAQYCLSRATHEAGIKTVLT
ncbi:MAG: asparagine synthase (glutamine-hydrolyzing), partial [Terriglobia bacterium]